MAIIEGLLLNATAPAVCWICAEGTVHRHLYTLRSPHTPASKVLLNGNPCRQPRPSFRRWLVVCVPPKHIGVYCMFSLADNARSTPLFPFEGHIVISVDLGGDQKTTQDVLTCHRQVRRSFARGLTTPPTRGQASTLMCAWGQLRETDNHITAENYLTLLTTADDIERAGHRPPRTRAYLAYSPSQALKSSHSLFCSCSIGFTLRSIGL